METFEDILSTISCPKKKAQKKWLLKHPEYVKQNGENNKKKFHEGSEEYKEHIRKLARERFRRYYEKKKLQKLCNDIL